MDQRPLKVAITGASGFIGRALAAQLAAEGHSIVPVSIRSAESLALTAGANAVVHLAGETVAQRWTKGARQRILDSRVEGTRALIAALRAGPPQVLISASAVGYYGSRGDQVLTENASGGGDFLSGVAAAWEQEAQAAEHFGVRVVRLRIGMVLGPGGGALDRMLLPFRLGLGARLGDGRQWISWIHLSDLLALIGLVLRESTLRGVLNATAPHPVQNAEFTRALASALGRPAFLFAPAPVLRFLLGEMSELLLASQRAVPEAALRAGFTFQYPEVFAALHQILAGSV